MTQLPYHSASHKLKQTPASQVVVRHISQGGTQSIAQPSVWQYEKERMSCFSLASPVEAVKPTYARRAPSTLELTTPGTSSPSGAACGSVMGSDSATFSEPSR